MPTTTLLALGLTLALTWLLARPLGLARALGAALAVVTCVVSVAGLALLDAGALRRPLLELTVLGLGALVLGGAAIARGRWLAGTPASAGLERASPPVVERRVWVGLGLVLTVGVGLRLSPSPYLHGGQDQGIYVSVGHLVARTGQHRAIDPVMAGAVRGISARWITDAHGIEPVAPGSPREGVREGRWMAGVHVEDASEGRVVPAFFHLLPTWFAIAELDWGFAHSTWPLVWFACCSQVATFALVTLLARRGRAEAASRHAPWLGVLAAGALALHPLDLWISTFTVTENLARPALLGSAAFALLADDAERTRRPGVATYAVLAGLTFTLGAFARGSMIALAVIATLALSVAPTTAPRARRILVATLAVGIGLAITQGIWNSWPYFFSAASNHFLVPRIQPFRGEATAWTVLGVATVITGDAVFQRVRPRLLSDERMIVVVRSGALLALLAALLLAALRYASAPVEIGPVGTHARSQQVMTVLVRHGGGVGVALGIVGLAVGAWRATSRELPWVALATVIVLITILKPGVRYEFYYARYLVGDAIPVLVVGGAALLGAAWERWGGHARATAAVWVVILAWVGPPLAALRHPVYWQRDLARAPEEQAELLAAIPDGAVIVFDDREPGRWRGILATPFFLAHGRSVLIHPQRRVVEGAISAGTPVYLVSGGWEDPDHQRWSGWHTTVVARGVYEAKRAEIVEGGAPRSLTEWGGPWEVQRVDPSIFRDDGAFSLHRGSRFIARDEPGRIETEALELRHPAGAFVELRASERSLAGCTVAARPRSAKADLPQLAASRPNTWRFALPPPGQLPRRDALVVTWSCDGQPAPREVTWHRVSLRWERAP